jgi:hypothetical protein
LLALFRDDDFRVAVFLPPELFREADLFAPARLEPDLAVDFLVAFLAPFLGGTSAPARRASLNAMAIACFGFFTFLRPPDFSSPCLYSCMTFSTFPRPLRDDDFRAPPFF